MGPRSGGKDSSSSSGKDPKSGPSQTVCMKASVVGFSSPLQTKAKAIVQIITRLTTVQRKLNEQFSNTKGTTMNRLIEVTSSVPTVEEIIQPRTLDA